MRTYYINRDQDHYRRVATEKEIISNLGVSPVRVPAYTPDYLDIMDVVADKTKYARELSCTMSHIRAINRAYRDGCGVALIVEDDVVLTNTTLDRLNGIVESAPHDCKMIHLFGLPNVYHDKLNGLVQGDLVRMRDYPSYITTAYVITLAGMRTINAHVSYMTYGREKYNMFYCPDDEIDVPPLYNHMYDYFADHFLPVRMMSGAYRTTVPLASIRGTDTTIQMDVGGGFAWYHKAHQLELKIIADAFMMNYYKKGA